MFHEIYSCYYLAVGRLIRQALQGGLNDKEAAGIIGQSAFSESFLYIMDAVKSGQWPVLNSRWETPLQTEPRRPLTSLELRWLATVCHDLRFTLFCDEEVWERIGDLLAAEGVEPLYTAADFIVTDTVMEGDPYEDVAYQKHFRTVLSALREQRPLLIAFRSGKGKICRGTYRPWKLEYSEKEDRFRLLAWQNRRRFTINISRILECTAFFRPEEEGGTCDEDRGMERRELRPDQEDQAGCRAGREGRADCWAGRDGRAGQHGRRNILRGPELKSTVTVELTDERSALERAMVHFADLEKVTRQLGDRKYEMKLSYRKKDETEILIRILSFGPMLKVTGPQRFLEQVRQRLQRQCARKGRMDGQLDSKTGGRSDDKTNFVDE